MYLVDAIQLLEPNWQFANFSLLLRNSDPMLIVENKIVEHHGRIENIAIYLDI